MVLFGEFKVFNLVKDSVIGFLKGYVFCEYVDFIMIDVVSYIVILYINICFDYIYFVGWFNGLSVNWFMYKCLW